MQNHAIGMGVPLLDSRDMSTEDARKRDSEQVSHAAQYRHGMNLYEHALGNPVIFVDPEGLSVISCLATLMATKRQEYAYCMTAVLLCRIFPSSHNPACVAAGICFGGGLALCIAQNTTITTRCETKWENCPYSHYTFNYSFGAGADPTGCTCRYDCPSGAPYGVPGTLKWREVGPYYMPYCGCNTTWYTRIWRESDIDVDIDW